MAKFDSPKLLRGDVLHALLVTHRTAVVQQDSSQESDEDEGEEEQWCETEWKHGIQTGGNILEQAGGHSSSSVHTGVCARKILKGERKTTKIQTTCQSTKRFDT